MGEPKTKVTEIIATPEEEEAATVVIDFKKIQEELTKSNNIEIQFNASPERSSESNENKASSEHYDDGEMTETEIQTFDSSAESSLTLDNFDGQLEALELSDKEEHSLSPIKTLFFDFNDQKLSLLLKKKQQASQKALLKKYDFELINKLDTLNAIIKREKELYLVFYYNQNPKAINLLMKQINQRFQHIKTLIIADKLSEQKASLHQKTASGAKAYLSTPKNFDDVLQQLESLS